MPLRKTATNYRNFSKSCQMLIKRVNAGKTEID